MVPGMDQMLTMHAAALLVSYSSAALLVSYSSLTDKLQGFL